MVALASGKSTVIRKLASDITNFFILGSGKRVQNLRVMSICLAKFFSSIRKYTFVTSASGQEMF